MTMNIGAPNARVDSKKYFAALGAQVAKRRIAQGLTQAELAQEIGVSQQALFAYEQGDRRISVIVLIKLAKVFRVTLEQLVGLDVTVRVHKGRLSPRAMRHAERLQALSKTHQRFVIKILDTLDGRIRNPKTV